MKKPFSLCGESKSISWWSVVHVIVIFSDTEPEGGSEGPRAWPPPFLLDLRFVRFWLRHVRCYLGPPRFCLILMTHPHWQSIFNTLPFTLCFRRLISPSVRSENHAILPQKRYFPPPFPAINIHWSLTIIGNELYSERFLVPAVYFPQKLFAFFCDIVTRLAEMCLVFLGRYSSDSQAIKDAIATVEQISCVRFKTRTNEQYYIKFVRGNG